VVLDPNILGKRWRRRHPSEWTNHGPFSADDPEWDAQARLEEKLLKFCYDKTGREPSIGAA
jgi:hypothetical protein